MVSIGSIVPSLHTGFTSVSPSEISSTSNWLNVALWRLNYSAQRTSSFCFAWCTGSYRIWLPLCVINANRGVPLEARVPIRSPVAACFFICSLPYSCFFIQGKLLPHLHGVVYSCSHSPQEQKWSRAARSRLNTVSWRVWSWSLHYRLRMSLLPLPDVWAA